MMRVQHSTQRSGQLRCCIYSLIRDIFPAFYTKVFAKNRTQAKILNIRIGRPAKWMLLG